MKILLLIFIFITGCTTTKSVSKWKEVCHITTSYPFKQCYPIADD